MLVGQGTDNTTFTIPHDTPAQKSSTPTTETLLEVKSKSGRITTKQSKHELL